LKLRLQSNSFSQEIKKAASPDAAFFVSKDGEQDLPGFENPAGFP